MARGGVVLVLSALVARNGWLMNRSSCEPLGHAVQPQRIQIWKICSPNAVLSFTFTYQNKTIETDMCRNADFTSVKRHRSSIGATANVVFTVGRNRIVFASARQGAKRNPVLKRPAMRRGSARQWSPEAVRNQYHACSRSGHGLCRAAL